MHARVCVCVCVCVCHTCTHTRTRAGIPIDMVGGTSIGALIGALYCEELDTERTTERARKWAKVSGCPVELTLSLNAALTSTIPNHTCIPAYVCTYVYTYIPMYLYFSYLRHVSPLAENGQLGGEDLGPDLPSGVHVLWSVDW